MGRARSRGALGGDRGRHPRPCSRQARQDAIFSGNFADYQFTTLPQFTPDGHLERFLEVYDTPPGATESTTCSASSTCSSTT
jgi:hypothetical protein